MEALIHERFQKKVRNDRNLYNAYLLVHAEALGIHLNLAEGTAGDVPAHAAQPYFIASIGKLFASVLAGILVEKGKMSYEDTINQYLDGGLLDKLHVYKGKDYTDRIKIKHLLNHTSGLQDYFEDKPKSGKRMLEVILGEPDRFWTPQEVIRWSKQHLKSHFPPGKGFHYSDTGYHLMGLVIEKITSKPFHQALHQYLFAPLGMKHSYLLQYSQPAAESEYPVAGVYLGDTNIVHYRSLSVDYAGGGIVATSEDLLKFMKALVQHEIIREDTFAKMKDWAKFSIGID
ncbi:MAG: beta-lactamase family protein, partial [candidate division KSB1 bacterium]|nr:beta-lactamase family protein [candidate division KSB1 bacterium]